MTTRHTCPECGGHNFRMSVVQTIHVDFSDEDGPEVFDGPSGEMGWGDNTEADCLSCGHSGPLGEMAAPEEDPIREAFCKLLSQVLA